jgi:hypothetical protein
LLDREFGRSDRAETDKRREDWQSERIDWRYVKQPKGVLLHHI